MKTKKDIGDELKQISPYLANLKKLETGFRVPENYFGQLQNEIFEKAKWIKQPPLQTHKASLWDQVLATIKLLWTPAGLSVGISSTIVIIVCLLFLGPVQKEAPIALSNLTYEDLDFYLTENIDEFDDDLLIKMRLQSEQSDAEQKGVELDEEEIEEYFNHIINEIDVEILEDLL